jgi:hypothetical protein
MKKYTFLFVLPLILLGFSVVAQPSMYAKGPGGAGRAGEYSCPENSVFSQTPSSTPYTFFGEDNFTYSRIADDYVSTGPIGSMRFWGVNFAYGGGCTPGATIDFIIKFYGRNLVDPTIPGTEAASFTITATPVSFPLAEWPGWATYQIDVNFPTGVTLTDGWISITRTNASDGCQFGWMGTEPGTGNSESYSGNWVSSGGNLAFCLGPASVVPVSNWAIFAGLLLIGTFIVLRYRRIG